MISPSQFATIGQFKQTTDFVDSLISCLDAPAVGELMSGYEKDVDEVLRIIYEESQKVLFESKLTPSGSLGHIPYVSKIFEDTACSASLPYFITTHLPDFDMEEFHIEWSIITQMYLRTSVLAARGIGKSIFFSKAVPLWRMYRYRKGTPLNPVSRDIELCRDGLLVSNEYSLARELLGIVRKEIEENDSLRERLYPDNRENWGKDSIITQNGARLQVKSVGSRIRGLHPTYVIGDDLLDDSCLYSVDQNNKFINFFHSVIMNAIIPDGPVNIVGTPFSDRDLYSNLSKSDVWRCFSYPLINPRGEILSRRFTMQSIDEKLTSQGSIIFSREILVKPITSNSTLFPYSLTRLATRGMEKFTLVHNLQSFRVPMVRVGIGVDIATSANIGADYFVITVVGKDDIGRYWLLHVTRAKGWTLGQQLGALKRVARDFDGTMTIETNQAQVFLADAAMADGLSIVQHNTGANKFDAKTGLIGMSVLFERNLMKFPYGDQESKNFVDLILDEFASITFTDKGKLQGVGAHDDTVMSLWLAIKSCNYSGGEFRANWW